MFKALKSMFDVQMFQYQIELKMLLSDAKTIPKGRHLLETLENNLLMNQFIMMKYRAHNTVWPQIDSC